MKKSEKMTLINPITISVGRHHQKLGGNKCQTPMITNKTWGGNKCSMLIDEFRRQVSENYEYSHES